MNKLYFYTFFFTALFVGCADTQKLIVTPDKASPQTAKMEFVENGKIVNIYDVLIGRNGAAKDGEKREGDGKTPSGTFKITSIFGKSDHGFDKMGFIKTYPDLYCIDDVKSENYNKIADKNLIKKDFDSFEFMYRADDLYDIGAVIGYNESGEKGLGSCIFLHVKSKDNKPTAGCVAMEKIELDTLLKRLDSSKNPIIIIR